jgi:hypothetical protein
MAEAEAYASQPRDAAAGIYTETLARLYLKQGFGEHALAIYRRLAQEQPDNHQLHERLRTLEQELACGEGGSDPAGQCAAPDRAGERATQMIRCQERQVAAQLGLWLRYLQRQRLQRERFESV